MAEFGTGDRDDMITASDRIPSKAEGRVHLLLGGGLAWSLAQLAMTVMSYVARTLYLYLLMYWHEYLGILRLLLLPVLELVGIWGLYLRYHERWLKVYVVIDVCWPIVDTILFTSAYFLYPDIWGAEVLLLVEYPIDVLSTVLLAVCLAVPLLKIRRTSSTSGLLTVVSVAVLAIAAVSCIDLYIMVQRWFQPQPVLVLASFANDILGLIFSLMFYLAFAYVYYLELRACRLKRTSMLWE